MSTYKVYICSKASDIDARNRFYQHIIAHYGSNTDNLSVYCHDFRCDVHYSTDFIHFIIDKMTYLCKRYNSILFYFYSPQLAHLVIKKKPMLAKYIPFLNSHSLLHQLDDKIICRNWAKNFIDVVPFQSLSFASCLEQLQRYNEPQATNGYVIQYSDSCGGEGTYIITHNGYNELKKYLQVFSHDTIFLLSPYYETSISVTCHFIVYEDTELIFPIGISKSLLSNDLCRRPIYKGTDFTQPASFPSKIKNKIYENVKILSRQLALIGYRGICGVDFLIIDNNVHMLEINPRYLGSSYLVDMTLLDNHIPPLAYFNELAFTQSSPERKYAQIIKDLKIPYEGYIFSYNECFDQNSFNTLVKAPPTNWKLFWDGLDINIPLTTYEKDTYLFRACEKR